MYENIWYNLVSLNIFLHSQCQQPKKEFQVNLFQINLPEINKFNFYSSKKKVILLVAKRSEE